MRGRLVVVVAVLVAVLSPAAAQPTFNLVVSEAQLNLIGRALGKLPFDEVSQTISVLAAQVAEQQKAAAKPPEPKPSKE